ncbi:unnamed protein product [Schistosoma turkestanicum]|nr:unnamed protein product [Schistosoma turkestanicum]
MSEIQLLHNLSVVRLCKRLLSEETDKNHLQKNGHTLTQEDRLIMRLKSSKPLSTFIKSFRERHEDWISLVHYLFYKNISGKWKSREQKRRNRKVRGSLPLPPAPVQKTEFDISEDQSNSHSSYRIHNACSESENCVKKLSFKDTLADKDIFNNTNIAMPEIITRLLERKGIPTKSNDIKTTSGSSVTNSTTMDHNLSSITDGSIERTVNKSKKLKLPLKSNISSNSNHEIPAETHQLENSLIDDELDDPLGDDDKEARKLFKKKHLKNPTKQQHLKKNSSSYISHKKQNVTKFPDRMKPKTLQMHKTTSNTATETAVISELSKPDLHPSWQAKRLEKAKVVELCKGPVAEVKHIVFTD